HVLVGGEVALGVLDAVEGVFAQGDGVAELFEVGQQVAGGQVQPVDAGVLVGLRLADAVVVGGVGVPQVGLLLVHVAQHALLFLGAEFVGELGDGAGQVVHQLLVAPGLAVGLVRFVGAE